MANTYLHGVYAEKGETFAANAVQSGSFPCYFGTAPVHLVRQYVEKNLVNSPVKLTQASQAKAAIGYADDWQSYTLCEVIKAHFENTLQGAGPVYVINVLDPEKHKKEEATQISLTFVHGRVEFPSTTAILDTVAIEDKAEGVDFSVDYDYARGMVILKDLKGELEGAQTVKYYEVDPTKVTAEEVIGGQTAAGEYSGIGALPLIGIRDYVQPTYLAAPGWSHLPEVRNALLTAAQAINGKFKAFVYTDIPVKGEEGGAASIEEAIAWKEEKDYVNENEAVAWPKAKDNEGNVYHLSTLLCWRQQLTDFSHDSIPYETASNKEVPVSSQYFGEGATNAGYDETAANELNAKGINTLIPRGNKLVFWGGHTSAYSYGATTDAVEIFDTNVLTINYICNAFVREYADDIDKPMTVQKRDEIINREQNKLNALVTRGALLGTPTVLFLEADNSTVDMLNGDFQFRDIATVTPHLKSLTVTVHFSDEGFSSLISQTN